MSLVSNVSIRKASSLMGSQNPSLAPNSLCFENLSYTHPVVKSTFLYTKRDAEAQRKRTGLLIHFFLISSCLYPFPRVTLNTDAPLFERAFATYVVHPVGPRQKTVGPRGVMALLEGRRYVLLKLH